MISRKTPILAWLLAGVLLDVMVAPVHAQPKATPDEIRIEIQEASISRDGINFITIFNSPIARDLDDVNVREFERNDQVPVGEYKVLKLVVTAMSWSVSWSNSNPNPCDGAVSGGPISGFVDLRGNTEFYFKTADFGGNTLAYYRATPPLSGYIGDNNHPFLLPSPFKVERAGTTTVALVIGVKDALSCNAVTGFDGSLNFKWNLSGPETQLSQIGGIHFGSNQIAVTNSGNNSVTIYNWTPAGVDGSPDRILIGPATRLNKPYGIYIDTTHDEIVVANRGNSSLTVYNRFEEDNTAPLRTITGLSTGLDDPSGVFMDETNNEIYVANQGNNSIVVFNRTATLNSIPLRAINRLFISAANNSVSLTETGSGGRGNVIAPIAPGPYPSEQKLAEAVDSALEKVTSEGTDFTVTYNSSTQRFSIKVDDFDVGVGSIIIYWSSSTARTVLGFTQSLSSGGLGIGDFDESDDPVGADMTGLDQPCGIYVTGLSDVDLTNDEIFVTNKGSDSISVYKKYDTTDPNNPVLKSGNLAPDQTIAGADTQLSDPCGTYVDTVNNKIYVANTGNGTVTIYNRTDSGNVSPQPPSPITGLNEPVGLYAEPSSSEIGVAHRGGEVAMAFMPSVLVSSHNQDAVDSVLNETYNVILYGVDLVGINGHGFYKPAVVAEIGTAVFDPNFPWPAFRLSINTQIKRQVIEPDCPTDPNFTLDQIGFYGIATDGRFYAFIPGMDGSIQGAFLPDGSAFVGSVYDSSSRLRLIYGVRSTGSSSSYLTSNGQLFGTETHYSFTTYRHDLFAIERPTGNDLLRYLLGIGMAKTDGFIFFGAGGDTNSLTILNPMGDFADPVPSGPIFRENSLQVNLKEKDYTASPGGLIEVLDDGLKGAVTEDGGVLAFIRDTMTQENGCNTDIGFGMGLRQGPAGTFGTQSLRGTYFVSGFGDVFDGAREAVHYRSTAIFLTFDGAGTAEAIWFENQEGAVSWDRAVFTYRISSRAIPEFADVQRTVDVVDLFGRPSAGPYFSGLIGEGGKTLALYRNLNPDDSANLTRFMGLGILQHP